MIILSLFFFLRSNSDIHTQKKKYKCAEYLFVFTLANVQQLLRVKIKL